MDVRPTYCPLQTSASVPIPRTRLTRCLVLVEARCFRLTMLTGDDVVSPKHGNARLYNGVLGRFLTYLQCMRRLAALRSGAGPAQAAFRPPAHPSDEETV